MPEVRTATVLSVEALDGFHTVVAEADGPLGALPGQWGAFHTGVPNPLKPGEVLRRAWSFAEIGASSQGIGAASQEIGAASQEIGAASRSVVENRFRLFVATVGPGTEWLAAQPVGATLRFTGPWGSRFRLDEGRGPAAFFAAGSGISPIGAMVDACIATGRPAHVLWETPVAAMLDRVAAWRAAGVEVEIAPRLEPRPDGATWWFAGDGARLDEVIAAFDAPSERVERFYTPRPASQASVSRASVSQASVSQASVSQASVSQASVSQASVASAPGSEGTAVSAPAMVVDAPASQASLAPAPTPAAGR